MIEDLGRPARRVLTDAPLAQMRRRALEDRELFTVEGHIGELVALYQEVRGRRPGGLRRAWAGAHGAH